MSSEQLKQLQEIGQRLVVLEAEGKENTDEYESLSEAYQDISLELVTEGIIGIKF